MGASTKAMVVDYEYCLGCSDCELACMAERDVGPEKMGIKGQAACVRHCSYNVIACGEVDDLIASVKMKPKMTLFTIRSK